MQAKKNESSVRVRTYLAKLVPAANWIPGMPSWGQDLWPQHAAFVNKLVDDEYLYMGGPASDFSAVFLILHRLERDELLERLSTDPWLTAGILKLETLTDWSPLVDPRQGK